MERRMVWPPRVVSEEQMGILRDETGEKYPRDIGRSSEFSDGSVVIQFGDTFDPKGRFWEEAINDRNRLPTSRPVKNPYNLDNTCAIVVDKRNPAVTKYNRDERGKIHEFIPPITREFLYETPRGTTDKIWSFSGIVETSRDKVGIIHGYTWFRIYQKGHIDDYSPPYDRFAGSSSRAVDKKHARMGVCKVEYNPWKKEIKALKPEIEPTTLSNFQYPIFGYTCALKVNNYIYLYGQSQDGQKDIMLARTPVTDPMPRRNYQFWTGYDWSDNVKDCQPVMRRIEHGQIFETNVFGKNSDFKYCFVGENSFGDSKVFMARAKSPEGPWDDGFQLQMKLYNSPWKEGRPKYYYCIYPHPWAFGFNTRDGRNRTGELMITWCEGGLTGHVLAAKISLALEDDVPEPLGWNHGPYDPGEYEGPDDAQYQTGGNVGAGATYGPSDSHTYVQY